MNKKLLLGFIILLSLSNGFCNALIDDFNDGSWGDSNPVNWTQTGAVSVQGGDYAYEGAYGIKIDGTGTLITPVINAELFGIKTNYTFWVKTIDSVGNFGIFLMHSGVGNQRMFWGTNLYAGWDGDGGTTSILVAGEPITNHWYKFEIAYINGGTSAIYTCYDSDGTTILGRAERTGNAETITDIKIDSYQGINAYDYTTYGYPLVVNNNATSIYDNSNNHFFEYNTIQELNITTKNSSNYDVPQTLIINITDLGISQNITSGTNFNITFDNSSVWNYTALVYNPFNQSVNLTTYFYTINSNITSVYQNVSINSLNDIIFTRNDYITQPFTYIPYLIYNGSYVSVVGSNPYVYSSTSSLLNGSYQANFTLNIELNGYEYNLTNNLTQYVYTPFIDDCSSYTYKVLNLTLFDEEEPNRYLNGTIKTTFRFINTLTEYNFTKINKTYQEYCINVNNTSYLTNVEIEYSANAGNYPNNNTQVDYSTRSYYLIKSNITSNSLITKKLFLLKDSKSESIIWTLIDQNNQPISNAYIDIMRYYVGDNVRLRTTSIAKTDLEGKAYSKIGFYPAYYQIIIYNSNGDVIYEDPSSKYYSENIQLIIKTYADTYLEKINGITLTRSYNQTSGLYTALISDTNSLINSVTLNAYEVNTLNTILICDSTETYSTSTTLFCTVNPNKDNIFSINVIFNDGTSTTLFYEKIEATSATRDDTKLILGIFLFMALVEAGFRTKSVSITLLISWFGLLIIYILGLIIVSQLVFVGLSVLFFILLFMVVKR